MKVYTNFSKLTVHEGSQILLILAMNWAKRNESLAGQR